MSEKKPRRPTKKKIQKIIEKQGKVRAAFILRTEYGMKIKDISQSLNVGQRTVHSYISANVSSISTNVSLSSW